MEEVWARLFQSLDDILELVRPTQLVYFTFDGVAPRSKINHQRERRYMHASQLSDFIKDSEARGDTVPSDFFDSTCITPATDFMTAAGEQTQSYIASKLQQDSWRRVKFIFSGANTPGEGEHKIMDCLRGLQDDRDQSVCIYSPDADMILLGLVTHLKNVVILRETVHRNEDIHPRGFACERPSFDLIFLSVLREYFAREFPSLALERVVDDFVLLVTFVGNDFIPTIPTFDINEGALSYLMDAYREAGRYLIRDGTILWTELSALLRGFVKHEQLVLEKRIRDQGKMNKKRGTSHTKLLDLSEQKTEGETQNAAATLALIKESYYRDCFGIRSADENSSEQIRVHVKGYLEGIQWVMYYYYRGCQDWDWFYPQHYAPMLSDFTEIEGLIPVNAEGDLEFSRNLPYKHVEQLLMVFPPSAEKLIPEEYRHLFRDPTLSDLFPRVISIEHDILSAKATWSSVKVLLPFADRIRIQRAASFVIESESTQKLFTTQREKQFYVCNGEVTSEELEPSGNTQKQFSVPQGCNGEVRRDFPRIEAIEGNCKVTSDPGSGYMDEYKLPTMKYVITQREESKEFDSLVGKLVFTGFPFRLPSLVEFVSYKSRVCPHEQIARLSSDYPAYASRLRRDLSKTLSFEQGVEITPEICVVLHVKRVLGYKKTLLGVREYEFDSRLTEVPVELAQSIPIDWKDDLLHYENELQREFPVGAQVLLLDENHFAAQGTVTDYKASSDFYPKGNLEVRVLSSPQLALCSQLQAMTDSYAVKYYRIAEISQRTQQPIALIARFTQSIIVTDYYGDRTKKYEIGLNLRRDKERLCVPGATRWAFLWDQLTTEWEYAENVAVALEEYARNFPEVWDAVRRQSPNLKSFYAKEIFGYVSNHSLEIRKLGLWLMRQPTYDRKWASIKSQEAPEDLVKLYTQVIDAQPVAENEERTVVVNPGLAYISDYPPTPRFLIHPQAFSLGDRVLLLLPDTQSAPFASEGTVIATYSDTHLSVLLDKRIRNSSQPHPILTVASKFVLNLTRKELGVSRGPKDYACVDFQTGSGFVPAFCRGAQEAPAEISRPKIDIGAPSGDFKVVKDEDGLPISLQVDYPYDLEKFEFDYPDPLQLSDRSVDVQLPEGFCCKVLIDFVNK